MAANTSLVINVIGEAWIRDADGTLTPLQKGMKIPADAHIVTGNSGSSVQLQPIGQDPLTVGQERDIKISADVAQPDVNETDSAARLQADTDTARIIAALDAGDDPFDELDPTAAVLQGGSDDAGGSSFTRLMSIVETTTPLALEYPRPSWPTPDEIRLGGFGGAGNRSPELSVNAALLADQLNDDSDIINGLNVGQYFSDPDGHTLTFSATGLPPGLTIHPVTGVISGQLDSSASQGGPNSNGIYSVVVTATDPYGASVSLPFTWTALNPPPIAEDDYATTEENTVVTGNVLEGDPITGEGQDTDPDGDTLTVVEVTNDRGETVPAGTPISGVNENSEKGGGSFTINPDGSYSFDPGTDFDYLAVGEETTTTITYRISDGDGGYDTATLTITVTGTNDAPVLVPDVYDPEAGDVDKPKVVESGVKDDGTGNPNAEFPGHATATGNVLGNDSDPDDSDDLTVVRIEQNGQIQDVPVGGSTTLVGVYGKLLIGADGSYTYTLNNEDEDTERLAPGQRAEEVFTYTASDGQVEVSTTLTIVVHGTNDRPVIDDTAGTTGEVVEAGHEEPGKSTVTGELAATDVDAGHQHALTWHLIDDDGNVLNAPVQNIETDYGTLTLDSATGKWTYTLDDGKPATQKLAEGKAHPEEFTVRVQDPEGAWDETTIKVTVTGTNDAPVIVGADDEGSVRELPETHPEEENHLHSQTGEVRFSDVDANADEHQVSVAPKPGNEKDYGTFTANITAEGVVTWTFKVEDSDINELAEGETVVQDYVITITDGHGAPVEQTVRITITGTNDAPVVTSEAEQHEGHVTEHTEAELGHNNDVHEAKGVIKFSDDDLTDKHTISKADDPAGYLGTLTYAFNQETKEIEWTFTVPDADLNTLNKDDKVTQVYTFTIDDGNGGSVTQDVTITITGTNDIPEITADSVLSGSVTEQGVGNEDASPIVQGSLKGDDADSDASLSWSLVDGDGTGPVSSPDDDGAERKQELEGTYGKITLSISGEWVYELDNVKAQELAQNEQFVEEFVVRVYDEHGAYSQDVIKITVQGTNDAPTAVADSDHVVESGVAVGGNDPLAGVVNVGGNVLENDKDDDSGSGGFRVTGIVLGTDTAELKDVNQEDASVGTEVKGAYGTLTISANGTYTYALADGAPEVNSLHAGQKVQDIFTYVMTDGDGASSSTTLTINVTGTNDQPVINLDKSIVAKEVTEQGADNPAATDTVEGVLVADDPDSDGDEQTWQIVDANGNLVATLDGTYGVLILNESTGKWTYTLDNTRPATQALGNDNRPKETFTVRVTDKHGAYDEHDLVVTVQGSNDAPTAADHVVAFDEDPTEGPDENSKTGNVLEGAKNPEGGELTVISFTIDGDDTVHPVSENGEPVPVKVGDEEIGTFTLLPNGDYVFTPKEHYSGEVPVITYTIQEPANDNEDGLTADGMLKFEITPVADAPEFGEDADKTVKEDNTIPLGLTVPIVVDDTDHNKDGEGDNPELLGVITISGVPSGASLVYSDSAGAEQTIAGGQDIRIIIDGGPHTQEALDSGAIVLTEDQFQALQLLPNEHDHENIKLDISVTSYEVDDDGNPLPSIDGATTTITRDIDVRAVTDEVELDLDASVDGVEQRGDVFHISTDEDKAFKLSDALNAAFDDLDGSEERWIEISGLEPGSTVTFGGETIRVTAGNPVVKIPAFDTSGGPQKPGMDSFPEFSIKPPANWSGRMKDVTVTLVAQDHDGDSEFIDGPDAGKPYIAPEEKDSVKFHFDVAPVADGVSLGAAVGDEDTLINVLENVRKIDTDGSEQITNFELTLSKADIDAGWSFVDEDGNALEPNDKYTVEQQSDGSVRITFVPDAQGAIEFKGDGIPPIFLNPPKDSNTDIKLGVSIKTIDMANVGGTALDIRTQDGTLDVWVKPVAEIVDDGGVTMTEGHKYGSGITGTEDSWFALNYDGTGGNDGFDLKEGWSNRDTGEPGADTEDGEQTFALLTPKLVSGTHEDDSATGSGFRYQLADDSYQDAEYRVDLGGYLVPMEYLDTVEFQPPADVAGEFEIQVRAYTVDADHEGRFDDSTAVSGKAWLTGIVINPVADGVQSLGLDPAHGREDSPIALSIRPSSKDPSETFEVTISDLPDGSTLSYDGTVLAVVNGSVTIKDFDPQKELLFTPPEDASGRFDLKVEAVAVDTLGDVTSVSGPASGTLRVNVKGVADEPELELNTITVSEGELDGHDGEGQGISLGELVETAELKDTDGSETLSFKITGLPDGFTVEGASFAGGQGEGRVWTFTADQLNNVQINTPEHFSGKLPGTLTAISTERDGDSNSSISKNFSDHVTITPTPEAQQSLTQSATITEDQAGELNFSLDVSHGDGNEEVTAVYLNQVQLDNLKSSDNGGLQLFVGDTKIEEAVLGTEEIDGVMHYVIPQEMLDQITAQAGPNFAHNEGGSFTLDLKFDVIDTSNDGSIESDPVRFEGQYDITVTPVTDPMAADWADGEGSVQVDDQGAAQWTISTTGEHTAAITLTKPEDATAVGEDYDGSERLTQFIIDGAPEGMLVKGIQVDGGELLGTAVLVGPNKWVVSLPEHNALDFDGPLTVNVVFEATGNLATGQNDLSITAISQDRGADNTTAAQVGLTLTTGLDGGPGDGEAIEISWERNDDFAATEDTAFALSELVDGSVTLPGGDRSTADYSIILTLPEGSNVELPDGADGTITRMSVDADGDEVWVITSTGTPAHLEALLDQVMVTPPEDWNDNKRAEGDDFYVDASLNVVMPNGQQDSDELEKAELPVTPQTDPAGISVDFYTVDEDGNKTADTPTEGNDVGITVTVTNEVDGPLTVGDQVYIRVPDELAGEFFHDGEPAIPKSVSGVDGLANGDYLVLPLTEDQQAVIGNGESLELDLVFSPSNSFSGETLIDLDVWVPVKEQGSADSDEEGWVMSEGRGDDTIGIINNGYDITVGVEDPDSGVYSVTGNETSSDDPSGVIVLVERGAGALIDDSGREAVHSVRLDGLPNDFLAYYKDGNELKLATNAGTDAEGRNIWTIPTVDGEVPEISVLPPKHWSGTLKDLQLTVLSGETSLKDTDQHESTATFNLVVDPVADGLESLNAAPAFGREGDIIRLNLNAVMVDAVKVDGLAGSGAVPDESTESITLTLKGLGEHAAFYIGDTLIDGTGGSAFTYDSDDDEYTISGLSQDDISKLGVLQAVTDTGNQQKLDVTVEAWTVESGAPDIPSEKVLEGTFELRLYAQQATSGDDELLFDGTNLLDGGDGHDTVWLRFDEDIDFDAMRAYDGDGMLLRNIETLDLTRPGFDHELSNLSVQDVLDMTDDRNILTIKADDGDVINLLEGWERSEDLSVKATDGKIGKDVYVDISGDSSAQLHIEADPAFLKQIAESLKTDSNG